MLYGPTRRRGAGAGTNGWRLFRDKPAIITEARDWNVCLALGLAASGTTSQQLLRHLITCTLTTHSCPRNPIDLHLSPTP
jgi:hypothetical protein